MYLKMNENVASSIKIIPHCIAENTDLTKRNRNDNVNDDLIFFACKADAKHFHCDEMCSVNDS